MVNKSLPVTLSGTWLVFEFLLLLLLVAAALLYIGLDASDSDSQGITLGGYVAMTFGVIVTLALGIGLMSLMYSATGTAVTFKLLPFALMPLLVLRFSASAFAEDLEVIDRHARQSGIELLALHAALADRSAAAVASEV
jgi:hypothetical protein